MVNEYVVNYTARGNSELCLVATLQRYLNIAKINQNSEEFIFRSITSRKNHQHRTLRKKNVPLSCTNAKELFLAVVTAVGIEREKNFHYIACVQEVHRPLQVQQWTIDCLKEMDVGSYQGYWLYQRRLCPYS